MTLPDQTRATDVTGMRPPTQDWLGAAFPSVRRAMARLAAPFVAAATLCACATAIDPPITGYLCCNLRFARPGWISSDNHLGRGFVPAGEAVRLDSMKRDYYLLGTVGGRTIGLRDDAASNRDDTMRWVRRVVVGVDPRVELATWPPAIRAAVHAGKIVLGMSRAQVLMALGPPSYLDTPDTMSPAWRYRTAADEQAELRFRDDGTLAEVVAKPDVARTIVFGP